MVALLLKFTDLSNIRSERSLCGSNGYEKAIAFELYQAACRSVNFAFSKRKCGGTPDAALHELQSRSFRKTSDFDVQHQVRYASSLVVQDDDF